MTTVSMLNLNFLLRGLPVFVNKVVEIEFSHSLCTDSHHLVAFNASFIFYASSDELHDVDVSAVRHIGHRNWDHCWVEVGAEAIRVSLP